VCGCLCRWLLLVSDPSEHTIAGSFTLVEGPSLEAWASHSLLGESALCLPVRTWSAYSVVSISSLTAVRPLCRVGSWCQHASIEWIESNGLNGFCVGSWCQHASIPVTRLCFPVDAEGLMSCMCWVLAIAFCACLSMRSPSSWWGWLGVFVYDGGHIQPHHH